MRIYKKGDIVDIKVSFIKDDLMYFFVVKTIYKRTIFLSRAQEPSRRVCLINATMEKQDVFIMLHSML